MYTSEADFHTPGIYGEKEYEYGRNRRTCFTARRLEVIAVAGLLWTYFVLCLGCGGILPTFHFFVLFTSNSHRLLQVRGHLA